MSAIAAATVGTAIIGGVMGSNSSKRAAATQAAATREATALQARMYDQTRQDQQPWREAGAGALDKMQDDQWQQKFNMSTFTQDPSYQYQQDEAAKALQRSAAAGGGLMSGGTLKALQDRSQNIANTNYDNAFNRFQTEQTNNYNRLGALAGVGQTANAAVGAAGQNFANQAGSNMMSGADAAASGIIGSNNAINGGIGQALGAGANAWMKYNMNQGFGQGTQAGGTYADYSNIA